ncbi:uncharacterized protein LOC122029030 [Zingiber officinale]|uniref:uncharacterized protein LOC122029030 n=1 Tax=Zingiber officinale TaxID=94328 RepID=UPI001C4D7C0C|nr:uncharacterized protein LOC122029030 [Zingiber officinale]
MDIFSKVEVNIPLLKVIKNIPKHAKFLKDLCVHKRKLKGDELESMGKSFSALFQSMLQKCQDPGVFTIPCEIGESSFGDAMLDLGASINVMPKSVFQALGIGPLQPTRIVIQLANRSFAHPVEVLEDVLVKVRDLIFPADFYVLDMERDTLSRTLSMEFGDTRVQFNVLDVMKYPVEDHSILSAEVFDELEVDSDIVLLDCINSLKCQEYDEDDDLDFNFKIAVDPEFVLEASSKSEFFPIANSVMELVPKLYYSLEECSTPMLPSILKPPKLELKVLPEHLKYVYLREKEQLPVIIANGLELDQENKLLKVLRSHQQAIGWTVADIVGIDSSICMH